MKNFRDLKVWHKAHELTLLIYKETKNFPREELFGLTSQIRRSCASIPANIAEGCGKSSNADLAKYLQIALGSANELEYHLLLVRDLEILDNEIYVIFEGKLLEVKRMLASLITKIRTDG